MDPDTKEMLKMLVSVKRVVNSLVELILPLKSYFLQTNVTNGLHKLCLTEV